jgi:hypothetical protein
MITKYNQKCYGKTIPLFPFSPIKDTKSQEYNIRQPKPNELHQWYTVQLGEEWKNKIEIIENKPANYWSESWKQCAYHIPCVGRRIFSKPDGQPIQDSER